MPIYDVVWRIQIDAETPREAAEQALRIHRDPNSIATVFEIRRENISCVLDNGEFEEIDLCKVGGTP